MLQTMSALGPLQQASPAGLGCGGASCAWSACPTRLALTCWRHGRQQPARGNTHLAGHCNPWRLEPLPDAARLPVACSSGCSSGCPQQPLHLDAGLSVASSFSFGVGHFRAYLSWHFQWSAASSQAAEGAGQAALHFPVTLPHALCKSHAACVVALLIMLDIQLWVQTACWCQQTHLQQIVGETLLSAAHGSASGGVSPAILHGVPSPAIKCGCCRWTSRRAANSTDTLQSCLASHGRASR